MTAMDSRPSHVCDASTLSQTEPATKRIKVGSDDESRQPPKVERIFIGGLEPSRGLRSRDMQERLLATFGDKLEFRDWNCQEKYLHVTAFAPNGNDNDENTSKTNAGLTQIQKVYHNTKWKGCKLTVSAAQPHFLERLELERKEINNQKQEKQNETASINTAPTRRYWRIRRGPPPRSLPKNLEETAPLSYIVQVDTKPIQIDLGQGIEAAKRRRLNKKGCPVRARHWRFQNASSSISDKYTSTIQRDYQDDTDSDQENGIQTDENDNKDQTENSIIDDIQAQEQESTTTDESTDESSTQRTTPNRVNMPKQAYNWPSSSESEDDEGSSDDENNQQKILATGESVAENSKENIVGSVDQGDNVDLGQDVASNLFILADMFPDMDIDTTATTQQPTAMSSASKTPQVCLIPRYDPSQNEKRMPPAKDYNNQVHEKLEKDTIAEAKDEGEELESETKSDQEPQEEEEPAEVVVDLDDHAETAHAVDHVGDDESDTIPHKSNKDESGDASLDEEPLPQASTKITIKSSKEYMWTSSSESENGDTVDDDHLGNTQQSMLNATFDKCQQQVTENEEDMDSVDLRRDVASNLSVLAKLFPDMDISTTKDNFLAWTKTSAPGNQHKTTQLNIMPRYDPTRDVQSTGKASVDDESVEDADTSDHPTAEDSDDDHDDESERSVTDDDEDDDENDKENNEDEEMVEVEQSQQDGDKLNVTTNDKHVNTARKQERLYQQSKLESIFHEAKHSRLATNTNDNHDSAGDFSFSFLLGANTRDSNNEDKLPPSTNQLSVSETLLVEDQQSSLPGNMAEDKAEKTNDMMQTAWASRVVITKKSVEEYVKGFFCLNEGKRILQDGETVEAVYNEELQKEWLEHREQLTHDWKRKRKFAMKRSQMS